jgi:hypothetical protein
MFERNANAGVTRGDQEEADRRLALSRYVSKFLTTPIFSNPSRSALEKIEKRSQELLDKGTAARFIDKKADSREVARLVDQLREAIVHYQVSHNRFLGPRGSRYWQLSQQQAIYDRITGLTVGVLRLTPSLC